MGKDNRLIHAWMIVSAITIVYLNSLSGVFLFDDVGDLGDAVLLVKGFTSESPRVRA